MKTIYFNRRAWRVRIAQAAVWLGAALCVWLALFAPANPSDRMADKVVAAAGACFMASMVIVIELYLRLYVVRIVREGNRLALTTLTTLHQRLVSVDLSDAVIGELRRDRSLPGLAPSYDNSWRCLKAKGQLLPFIIDLTGDTPEDRERASHH